MSKEYAAAQGCHNLKCIGGLELEDQVLEWDLSVQTSLNPLTESYQNCRYAHLNKAEIMLFNRMCDRLMHDRDLTVTTISSARSVKSLNLGVKLNERTIAVFPRIINDCTQKS